MKDYKEARVEESVVAKEIEERKNDEDFSVLLASPTNTDRLKDTFEEYNKKYYPNRDYKVVRLSAQLMVIQTGGKSLEEIKDRILEIVKGSFDIIGRETRNACEELIPIEELFNIVPQCVKDYKATHAVIYA